ncbi:hypothetical protein CGRA01v4_05862 [Colletotrichum graminicola]|uniref:Uncharacterized protein n=1 Tax=Colletotrichum graminicola (strain M1.001 / M2 / FGSC 10212) TaxID=645133 RepID=E3QNT3_COLGM|nr:uncharacterized protein GLRG_07710 [Colletotrichum graminicola M1.001]EFQ32440.1 hypothetical protein GLRG_07710 [Colletotrichum graminicola M1.001]WDK14581.1 hypothetical protein CGRA01v4_05862 [Colletotrichum graminicola]
MTATSDPNPMTTKRGAAPLTTVFTTPDFCNSKYWTDTITPPLSSVVCMPPSWHQLFDYSWGFYSPGICPTGYTEGCAFPTSLAFTSSNGDMGLGGPVIAGETPRLCCPTGYTCYTGESAYSKCISTKPTTTFYDINNQLTSQLALVYAIQVRWQESDLPFLQTNPTVPGATYTAPASAGSGASATARAAATATGSASTATGSTTAAVSAIGSSSGDDGSSRGGDDGGISVGTTVGIAVGSVLGTLALALLGFMFWWRRRRRQEAGAREDDHHGGDVKSHTLTLPHEGPSGRTSLLYAMSPTTTGRPGTGTTVGDAPPPHSPAPTQLDSTNVMEMGTTERPQELPEDNEVYEMEGDMPGPPLYREKEGWPLR